MSKLHPLSSIHPGAIIADNVQIGPFCYIQDKVEIGAGTILDSHVTIKSNTIIGNDNYIGQGTILGGDPQDRKYAGEETFLRIGNNNILREYVTIHRASGTGNSTTIKDKCFIMAQCHIGHNCLIENEVTIANNTGISGYVTVEELVNIGGMTGIHQYCRVGKVSMVAGMTRLVQDAPPFMITAGNEKQEVKDINAIGLRRIGANPEQRMALHRACKLLFKSQLGLTNAIEIVREEIPSTEEIEYLLSFVSRKFQGRNGRGDQI